MLSMIYKLYKVKYKSAEAANDSNLAEFNKIYEKYNVKMLGGGINNKDPLEVYFMSVFEDEDHYHESVKKLQSDPKYVELTKKLNDSRESIEVISLEGME